MSSELSDSNKDQVRASVRPIVIALLSFGAVGLLFLILYANYASNLGLFAVLALLAFAAFCSGGLLGFLFGIPKYIPKTPVPVANAQAVDADDRSPYATNTNLEEMSDWLTKVIIGAGLVGLTTLVGKFNDMALELAACFDKVACSATVFGATLLSFAILGFIAIYLITRLYLAHQLADADPGSKKKVAKLDFQGLPPNQRMWLARLAASGGSLVLPPDFERRSYDHDALRALREENLIEPLEGGPWQPKKTVQLTPLGNRLKPEIENQLGTEVDKAKADIEKQIEQARAAAVAAAAANPNPTTPDLPTRPPQQGWQG